MKCLTGLLICTSFFLSAQKQGNIWYFGSYSGLNFNSGSPVPITGGKTSSDLTNGENQEGTACISDSSGALLFYTSGKTIWNRFHTVMQNGSGIFGGPSSTQAAIIVPLPGNDSIFYVFTSDAFQHYFTLPQKGYRYSVVNMCLDGGKGGVIPNLKNILLSDSSTEKLSACRDAAGTGYWILGHTMFSNKFKAWHLTSAGITATITSALGTIHGWNPYSSTWLTGVSAMGQMKFNPAGTKVATAIGNFDPAYLDLYDFNNMTGQLSNYCHMVIDSSAPARIYGVEFSSDGTKLYSSVTTGSVVGAILYQFDLTAGGGNCTAIKNSKTSVYQGTVNAVVLGLQMAPDNKIYVTCHYPNFMGRINFPNLSGLSCSFDPMAIIGGIYNTYALPAFIAGYSYSTGLVYCCNNLAVSVSSSPLVCSGQTTTLTASGASAYIWSNGPSTSTVVVSPTTPTSYSVSGTFPGGCTNTAVYSVSVMPLPTVNISASGSQICIGKTATLNAVGADTFTWNNSFLTNVLIVSPTVTSSYTVTGTNTLTGCLNTAVIGLLVNPLPNVIANASHSLICAGETATLSAVGADTFTWDNFFQTTVLVINPTTSTLYTVKGTNTLTGCSASNTIIVNVSECDALGQVGNLSEITSIYPNPNMGLFTLEYNGNQENRELRIVNMLGQIVSTVDLEQGKNSLNCSQLDKGAYYLILGKNKQAKPAYKLVIE